MTSEFFTGKDLSWPVEYCDLETIPHGCPWVRPFGGYRKDLEERFFVSDTVEGINSDKGDELEHQMDGLKPV